MNSVEQYNIEHAINGLEVVEDLLSTTANLTKQMKHSFALPTLIGGLRGRKMTAKPKEGRCACVRVHVWVCVYVCVYLCVVCVLCVCMRVCVGMGVGVGVGMYLRFELSV